MRLTTDMPGGNGRLISCEKKPWGWEIEFQAETKAREPMPLWFYFQLHDLSGERVRLRLVNSLQCLGGAMEWNTNHPVYRYKDGDWQRVQKVENGFVRKNILETWFEVPLKGDFLEFAFFYPFTQARMTRIAEELTGVFESDVIGYSAMGRPIFRYVNRAEHFHKDRPSVYLISRQHAAEATGTYEIEGIMRYLASEAGREALDRINWWFAPLLDIDGVEEGFYGKDQIYGDLNRAWAPWFAKRTEIVAVQYDIAYAKKNADLRLMMDLHAPGHGERDSYFVTKTDWAPELREGLRSVWERMAAHTGEYGYQRPDFHENPSGSNTSSQSGWTSAEFAHSIGVNGCSFECSYQGERNGRNYEIIDYQRIGECLARAIAETIGCR